MSDPKDDMTLDSPSWHPPLRATQSAGAGDESAPSTPPSGSDVEALCAQAELDAVQLRADGFPDASALMLDLVAALRASHEREAREHQRVEWAFAALAGDAIFGPAWDDPLFVAVKRLMARPVVPPEVRDAIEDLGSRVRAKDDCLMQHGSPCPRPLSVGNCDMELLESARRLRSLLAPAREPEERP